MRVLSSLLIAVQASLDFAQVEKDSDLERKHPANKLATTNKLANRLAIYSKGGNPDVMEEVSSGLYDKVMNHNNKYFQKLRKTLMEDGCGLMEKPKKNKTRRRRSAEYASLALDKDDYENLCDDLDDEDTELQCQRNEDGSIAAIDSEDGPIGQRRKKSFDLDPTKFIKNARKIHTSVKKFTTIFLQNCENEEGTRNDKRLRRNLTFLSRRMRDGIRTGHCTVEEVASTKWKRLYPKTPKGGPKEGQSWEEFFMGKATPKTRGPKDE